MFSAEIRYHTLPSADDISTIEDLSETDSEILSLYNTSKREPHAELELEELHDLLDEFEDRTCLIASPEDEPDEIATVANVDFNHGQQKAWIDGIATHPDYQGNKFGSEMMKFIERESKVRALAAVALNSVPTAIQFYVKAGYDIDDRQPTSQADDRVMTKFLDK